MDPRLPSFQIPQAGDGWPVAIYSYGREMIFIAGLFNFGLGIDQVLIFLGQVRLSMGNIMGNG